MSWVPGLGSWVPPVGSYVSSPRSHPQDVFRVSGLESYFSDMSFFYEKFLREVKKSES